VLRTLNYDPQAPLATITTPNGTVTATSGFTLSGTAPAGCIVTVNGQATSSAQGAAKAVSSPATDSGVPWSYSVAALATGINYFEVKVTDPVSGKSSSLAETVSYAQGAPVIAIDNPVLDLATAKSKITVTGTVTPGTLVSATINGATLGNIVSGAFSLPLPGFSTPGSYVLVISATDTVTGLTSSATRTIIYDPSVPTISVVSTSPLKVTATGGVLVSRDKNGPVGSATNSGGISSLDLTGASYDPASLNVYAVTSAGTSTRNGDLDGSGQPDLRDALHALQIAEGIFVPTTAEMLRGDVAPLNGGVAAPDGVIDSRDALAILRACVGLITLY
jgi:hypothetical protein